MNPSTKKSALLLFAGLLAACGQQPQKPQPEPLLPSVEERLVDERIAESAAAIEKMWAALGRLEQSRDPGEPRRLKDNPPPDKLPPELRCRISIEWSGGLTDLVKKLAKYSGYPLKETGPRPAVPVLITLSAENQTIAAILREAGYQAGKRAGVIVHDGPDPRIEVLHAR